MSITAINWARQQKTGTPLRQLVLFVLADYADQWGFCWPGQDHLASLCQVSDRSIRSAINDLEELGLLRKAKIRLGRQSHNLYRVASDPADEPIPEAHLAQKIADLASMLQPEDISAPNGMDRKIATVGPEDDDSLDRKHASGNPLIDPPENPTAPTRAHEEGARFSRDELMRISEAIKIGYRFSPEAAQACIDVDLVTVEQAQMAGIRNVRASAS